MPINPNGSEFRINAYTTGRQVTNFESPQSIAMDADGDFAITASSEADGSGYGVYAKRYNAAGIVQGNEFQVNTTTSNNQKYSTIAMDTDGDFVVTWSSNGQDGSNYGIYAKRYNAAGIVQGNEFRVNTTTSNNQKYSTVAMDTSGDFVVTWNGNGPGDSEGVFAQRYNAAGVMLGNEFRVNTTTSGIQQYSSVAMDTDGDFVVTWNGNGPGDSEGVFAQRYNAAGIVQGNEFRVNTTTSGIQQYSSVAMDTDGDFVVTWSSNGQDGSGWGIYAQRYNATGVAQGNEFRVNTTTGGTQQYSRVDIDANGDFVVTWNGSGPGDSEGVFAQRYNAAGVVLGNEFRVNTTTSGIQQYSSVATDADGDFAVDWSGNGPGDSEGVFAQRYQQVRPTLSIGDIVLTEGDSGTTNAAFTVTLSASINEQVTVNYATEDSTAKTPGDYTSATGTVTFASGQTTKTIAVPVVGDTVDEANETFKVNLSNPSSNATIADAQGVGTITDNDNQPTVSISPATLSKAEGNSGTTAYAYTVSLSNGSDQPVTVNYSTNNGTATTADNDYIDNDNVLTFNPGESLSQTITVNANGDTKFENDENFTVKLNSATNATINSAANQSNSTIVNDDAVPTVSISPATLSKAEGNNGTTAYTYTVSLSNGSTQPITVNYSTNDGTATSADGDYNDNDGTLTFNPGESLSQTITVSANGDTKFENDENFTVKLNSATNATINSAVSQSSGTIQNDDIAPTLSIDDVTVTEGDADTTNAVFTVSLSAASGLPVTVDYTTTDETSTAENDYTAATDTLTFAPGETTKTIAVPVVGDTVDEADKTFKVNLSNPSNATIEDAQGIGTIEDNDPAPTVSISSASPATSSQAEGNSGTTAYTYTVSLSNGSDQPITVNYSTNDGTATTTDGDYDDNDGTLTFNPGESLSQTITVDANGDTKFESDETFILKLDSATNATINSTANQSDSTIENEDTAPTLSIDDVTLTEGDADTTNAVFTVSLSAASGLPVTVDFATADETASGESDYAFTSSTLTFAPGETTQTIAVPLSDDTIDEGSKTFVVNLSNATNAIVEDEQGIGTIEDNDAAPTVSISTSTLSQDEGNNGTTAYTYTVSLSNGSDQPITVNYSTNDGTATTADEDYSDNDGSLTFNPGESLSQTITVNANSDTKFENDETFTVSLNGISTDNATLDPDASQTNNTITNDDIAPTLSIDDVSVIERDADSTNAEFTVALSAASGLPVTVDYTTADETATAESDYTSTSDSLTFAPGETTQTITVPLSDDTIDEANETFFVNLSNPTNATIVDEQGVGTVEDNDAAPTASISPATLSQAEGNSGTTAYTYTVSLSNGSAQPVSVNYSTNDGTATSADGDYNDNDGTLAFNPGESLSQTTTVNANGDTKFENDEDFFVKLDSATDATINAAANQSDSTIVNDDTLPNDGAGGKKQFTIRQGEGTVTLTNFGGVGKGAKPSLAIIAEADTLKLEGTGLKAGNLILTQTSDNLEVSFKGVADTKVVLQDFALENLDNLRKTTGASVDLGNILFNGQTTIQDSYDAFDANSTASTLFKRNVVNFLSDLNNTVNTFDNSNNVINAQGGNDSINGRNGNDLLRGGTGIDTLTGGTGNDLFAGDGGDDLLQGGTGGDKFFYNTDRPFVGTDVGVDTLPDFARRADKIVLDKTTFTALNDGFSFQRVTSDAAAANSSADVVYSAASGSTSGKLFYNPNGTADGFDTGAQFAVLPNLASPLAASDFLVIT